MKRKKLPGPSTVKEERVQLQKWQVVYADTSGKFQMKSARDKKWHLPIAFLQYTVRVGSWPRLLISDGAGELIETKLQRQFLTRVCKHEVAARGDHHVNDQAERAIQELDTMMRVSIHESNIPFQEWCFVVEYMCLIDMMTSYSTSNKSKTIFEGRIRSVT